MVSFEELKNIPKIDLHINFLSSISTNLAFDLNDELTYGDIIEMSTLNRISEYEKCLELPVKLLNTEKNIKLALTDLIKRLQKDNVIYGELFLDLPLYNKNISLEFLVNILLKTIKEENFNLQLVLCVSDKFSKEENMEILNLLDKYYNNGVNAVYFKKEKSTNLFDYVYIFDKLMRNNISYIVPFDGKITNQNREIYANAKRIEYLFDEVDEEILSISKEHNISIEFAISKLNELNYSLNIYEFIYRLIKENYNVIINSGDMSILNTDIINEYCLLFNNCDLTLLELVKLLINTVNNLNIDEVFKENLLMVLKDKSNEVL